MQTATTPTERSTIAALATRAVVLVALFAMSLAVSLAPSSALASEPSTSLGAATSLEAAELEVVRLHNHARAQAGLAPLDVHVDLHVDARRWSGEMAEDQRLQHQNSFNADAPYWETSCAVADPQWRACAENVALGPTSASAVHDAWMASASHRENILDPRMNRVGIGVWSDGERLWWTARFMRGTTADTADSTGHPQDGSTYDPDGPEGTVYRLYRAYFLREPDASGFEHWLDRYRDGQSLTSIADAFSRSEEFRGTYGSIDDRGFIGLVYDNVLGRSPDLDGYQYWLFHLTNGMTRGAVMINFSDSDEFRSRTADGVPPGFDL